ncbi:MAG: hypothetical protein F6K09_34740 [Merismopedia sp. SIO2A8]|nr:hypothetical protein [Symploca sp. SIO2B6]NET53624.1 hypothetical protein [Merismopedia sp. SIO2A8]
MSLSLSQASHNQNWPIQSVQHFFSTINWENVATQPSLPTLKSGERTLNPAMTVSEFFGAVPWDGERVIAPSPPEAELPILNDAPEDDLTLDDFFGSF